MVKNSEKFKVKKGIIRHKKKINKDQFGKHFRWGVATSAYQTEGAHNIDGKSPSIWDTFTSKKGNINNRQNGNTAIDHYHRFKEDIALIKNLNFNSYRFSLSWTRILPEGTGKINSKGMDFYKKIIDYSLNLGIEPWITLYHWDLPQILEDKGGWTNRDVVNWFSEYTSKCIETFGDKVKNWMILNEPMSFTGLGYYLGYHAPGRKKITSFLSAAHHAALCQAEGGRIVREYCPDANIGTTFSCSHIKPVYKKSIHIRAAKRLDAMLNRFFIEPALGLGYPFDVLPGLKKIEKYIQPGDLEKLHFNFDFIGLQYYFRTVTKFSLYPPILFAKDVDASKRNVKTNAMGMEIYSKGLFKILKKFSNYSNVKNFVITECGICLDDEFRFGKINDKPRIKYLTDTLAYTLRAMNKGINIKGYFVWTLADNFEWSEGFNPRFGLVYTDSKTLDRHIKDSGYWFQNFLQD